MSGNTEAKQSRLSPKLISGIILALFFGIALYIRVCLPYDQVFSGEWIKLTGVDAYYHMRLVDNLVYNFPHLNSFDPYFAYPSGWWLGGVYFFDWLLAGIIWVIGLGSPTQHTIDVVGVYFPAVLGALTVIPVYFIGKELFGRWAGVLSAGLLAVLPGEFLGRSILGFTDHHVAETLLTTTTIMFLLLAIKTSRQNGLTFNHIKRRDWAVSAKPVIYSLLCGIWLGIYFLSWAGAPLFVLIISAFFIIQFIIDHLKRQSTDYLCLVGAILFFVALLMYVPFLSTTLHLASLIVALLIPLALGSVSRLMAGKKIRPAYYPLTLVGLGLAGVGIFYAIAPSLLKIMLGAFSIFTPRGVALTTLEMQPFLFPGGNFSTAVAWGNFTTSFFLSFVSLGILIYLIIKHGSAEKSLLVVWSLVILATTLGQRRFAYYFAVNVALLTGYLSWQILQLAGFKEWITKPREIPKVVERKKVKPKKRYQGAFHITIRHIYMALAVLVVFFLVFYPNTGLPPDWNGPTKATAKQARFAPSDAWCSSLSWLKENTPEPFGNPNSYYQLYEPPPPEEGYNYPESAYAVTAWWDYGYWITRIAHRLPNCCGGGSVAVAQFLTARDEDSANKIRTHNKLDTAYVVIDYPTTTGKFWAIVMWAEKEAAEFFEEYYLQQEDKLVRKLLFHPEYYQSLSVRLYNFDGKAVTPERTVVISYQKRVTRDGTPIKLITTAEVFPSYEKATAYISSQKSADYKIVGDNPFISPVPLDALKHYKLVHSSDSGVSQAGVGAIPEVKIFEYTK